jgi:hypothetical protein
MRGKGAKLDEKGAKLGEGEGAKLGEGCPKVRLGQDRIRLGPFSPQPAKLGERRKA